MSYELLDFGHGRKLERFGPWVLDRPAPVAEGIEPAEPAAWDVAAARFERSAGGERGAWHPADALPRRWTVELGGLTFELKATEFGHLGLFPEHRSNWDWIAGRAAAMPLKVLNLFAYTGGATLAAASAGAEVAHVDAARNVVAWARRNAALSGLEEAPVRWIAEDAVKFVKRELKRGQRYDAVILDPPSYGHGPRGEVWRLSSGLEPLLRHCGELTEGRAAFVLVTCHTPGYGPDRLAELIDKCMPGPGRVEAFPLTLPRPDGRRLPGGVAARRAQ